MDFDKYLNNIYEPVIILDGLSQVVFVNAAFSKTFKHVRQGETLRMFFGEYPSLAPLVTCPEGSERIEHDGCVYLAHISMLQHKKGLGSIARCILFADITQMEALYKKTREVNRRLVESNRVAEQLNIRIKEKIHLEEESAVLRETTGLLRELHDTLGHNMTIIGALYNRALLSFPDEESVRDFLRQALRQLQICIAEIQSSAGFPGARLTESLRVFQTSMLPAGLEIVLEIIGEETDCHWYQCAPLMRICQEAATNSIKHGKASVLNITLQFAPWETRLVLHDNGRSGSSMGQGFGLKGMDERVNMLFGELQYGKDSHGGFLIKITAPVFELED